MQKEILKNALGERYKPSYNDFMIFIDPQELHFNEKRLLRKGGYVVTYGIVWRSWSRPDYRSKGFSYANEEVTLEILAGNEEDSEETRTNMFAEKVGIAKPLSESVI